MTHQDQYLPHLIRKTFYRELCDLKIPYDESVLQAIKVNWEKWKINTVKSR